MQIKRFFVLVLVCTLLFSLLGCEKADEVDENVPIIGPDEGYAGKVSVSVNLGNGTTIVKEIEGDGARQLVQQLTAMEPTGEQEEKITDAQWTSGYLPAEETPVMTAWLETDFGIFRANLDKETVCRVESHYAEGKSLRADAEFFELVDVLSKYWPYHTDTCTYRDGELVTEHQLTAPTTAKIKVKKVVVNKEGWGEVFSDKEWVTVMLQVESTINQTVEICLDPGLYGDVVYGIVVEKLEMRAGQKKTVTLRLPSPGPWWTTASITADNTRILLRNEDWLNR